MEVEVEEYKPARPVERVLVNMEDEEDPTSSAAAQKENEAWEAEKKDPKALDTIVSVFEQRVSKTQRSHVLEQQAIRGTVGTNNKNTRPTEHSVSVGYHPICTEMKRPEGFIPSRDMHIRLILSLTRKYLSTDKVINEIDQLLEKPSPTNEEKRGRQKVVERTEAETIRVVNLTATKRLGLLWEAITRHEREQPKLWRTFTMLEQKMPKHQQIKVKLTHVEKEIGKVQRRGSKSNPGAWLQKWNKLKVHKELLSHACGLAHLADTCASILSVICKPQNTQTGVQSPSSVPTQETKVSIGEGISSSANKHQSPIFAARQSITLTSNDIRCGRGAATNTHRGNIKYLRMIRRFQPKYSFTKTHERWKIVAEFTAELSRRDMRFLDKGEHVTDAGVIHAKISNALREHWITGKKACLIKNDVVLGIGYGAASYHTGNRRLYTFAQQCKGNNGIDGYDLKCLAIDLVDKVKSPDDKQLPVRFI